MVKEKTVKEVAMEAANTCACFKARQAARMITKSYDEAMKSLGLKATQFTLLSAVTLADGSLTLTQLAEHLAMDRTTLSRNLRPLESRDLVVLSDEGYRRARTVKMTKAGETLLRKAIPVWQDAQDRIRSALGDREWVAFHAQMERLVKAS